MTGHTIGHYRIITKIASGGMGDVFLAEDTQLDRHVALKTLPPEFAADADRRARLAREAKAIAALNHPNIVTVFSVEQANGLDFITMELVKGRTVAELLPRSGFALDRFFTIAIPLVDAIAAAHQYGVMHRDLKPGNVMVSDEGRVKVLDFGLAKIPQPAASIGASTITAAATLEGHVVGTPAYMSPEQSEGKAIDTRSDIFSLGVVFYEMLTGQRPFTGETSLSVLASVVKDAPRPIKEVNAAVPRDLARIVHRCLAKAPVDRYQSVIDLRHDLQDVSAELQSASRTSGTTQPTRARARTWKMAMVAAAAGLAATLMIAMLGVNAGWFTTSRSAAPPSSVPRLSNAVQVTSSLEVESYPVWSPDGQRVAFQAHDSGFMVVGNHDIWVGQVGSGDPVNLTKGSLANDRRPNWSPDGREIAFYSDRDGDWGIYIVSSIGGTPRKVLALAGADGSSSSAPQWSSDGRTLFVAARENTRNIVIQLSLASQHTSRLALPVHDSPQCWDLSVRPDGGRFAYVEAGGGNPEVGRLWTIAVEGGEPIPLTDGRTKVWSPTWSPEGNRLFYVTNRGGSMDLWQQSVGLDGRAVGEPLPLTIGMGITSAAFSPDGMRLAFSRAGRVSNIWRVPISPDRPATWTDATKVTSEHAYIEFVDVSHDGQQLAVSSDRRGNQDLWAMSAMGGEMTQLTDDPTPDWNPRWSPNGKEIAFYSYRSGNRDIWVMPSRGGPARQITFHSRFDWFPTWSPDGRQLAFQVPGTAGNETWIVPSSGGEPRFVTRGATQHWSPDGEWLIVATGQGKHSRVRVDGTGLQELPIPHRANWSRFSRDSQSVYYSVIDGASEDHDVWRLSLATGKTSRLTKLAGPRGRIGYFFATDDRYLYFTWYEDDGDIWVTDLVNPSAR